MAEVFISYSRKDQEFVRDLHKALTQRQLETWVDWEGIPLTADFLKEIYTAIEAADTFAFVISPDSIASEVCGLELAHAVAHHKRLVPIVRRDGAAKLVPEALAKLNWIFFRDEDDFERAFDALIMAIATDLDYVHMHTRFLIRALEWDSKERGGSLLLRGTNLREAEEWLASADSDKTPQPTPLQREYLLASRRAETERLRTLIGAAATAALVALLLSVLTLFQRNAALTQRQIADEQRGVAVAQGSTAVAQSQARATAEAIALDQRDAAEKARNETLAQQKIGQSRELAANAITQLTTDPELAIRLAAEAIGIARTSEAEDALRQALGLSHLQFALRGNGGAITAVAFSPDGKLIAMGMDSGTVRLARATTGGEVRTLPGSGARTQALAFSPDNGRVAVAGNGGTAELWDAAAGTIVAMLRGHSDDVISVAFSRDGHYLATTSKDKTARLWDGRTGAPLALLEGHTHVVRTAAFSPDGTRVVTASADGTARIWETETGKPVVALVGHHRDVYGADLNAVQNARFSPDGARVVTASFDGTARVWDAVTGQSIFTLAGSTPDSYAMDATFSPGGKRIVTASSDGTARVWDAATGVKQAELRGHSSFVTHAAFSPNGLWIVTTSLDKTARVWDAITGGAIAILAGHTDSVMSASFSPDGTRILTVSGDGTARLWEATAGAGAPVMPQKLIRGATGLPDGDVFSVNVTGALQRWNGSTGAKTGDPLQLGNKLAFSYNIAYSPDGARVALGSFEDGTVTIWDTATGRHISELHDHTQMVEALAFSPDGKRIASGSDDKTARIWEVDTGKALFTLSHGAAVYGVAWSGDGRRVVTGGDDGDARIWNMTTGQAVTVLHAGGGLRGVAFSPDGTRIVTGGSDNFGRIWDATRGVLLVELRGHTGTIRSAAFTPDGRQVLTAAWDGTARVWDATNGQSLVTLRGHVDNTTGVGKVDGAVFVPDGRHVLTWGDDDTARLSVCDVTGTTDDLLATVRARNVRPLTPDERSRFLPAVPA